MFRIPLTSLLAFSAIVGICCWIWETNPQLAKQIKSQLNTTDCLTLEAHYTPEQIMSAHQQELLPGQEYKYLGPSLKFYPHLILETRYTASNNKEKDGTLLWSLVDGEMVLNTETWEKTQGFQQALSANATANEFKVLNTLAKHGGSMTTEELRSELRLTPEVMGAWISSAQIKSLILQQGDQLVLNPESSKIGVVPQTKIGQWLTTKLDRDGQQVSQKFSTEQIEAIAKAAFGESFTILGMKEVSLPVYGIEVLNPDGGTVTTSFWNALNGKRLTPQLNPFNAAN